MDRGVNSTSLISLHAAAPADDVARCTELHFADDAQGVAPDWINLLPASAVVTTVDGRGPYRVPDLNALIERSLPKGGRLVIDENHSTDLAAPDGRPAPAAGWIVELQNRAGALWGRVEWTEAGKALVAGRAYRAISPALQIGKASSDVQQLLRASLVNRPNIQNLATLHQETNVNPLLAKLLNALGLKTDTSEDTLVAAVTTLHQQSQGHATELMSIAKAAGVPEGATAPTADIIVGAVTKLKTAPVGDGAVVQLQAQLVDVTNKLNAITTTTATDKATAFVDGAIKEGRVGVAPLRDHYIARHMTDSAGVEKEIAAFPMLTGTTIVPARPAANGLSLNASEESIVKQLGLDPKKFVETRDGPAAV